MATDPQGQRAARSVRAMRQTSAFVVPVLCSGNLVTDKHNQKLQIANNNTLKFEWISMLVRTAPRKAKTINQRIMLTTGTKQTFQMPKKKKTRKNPSGKNKLLDMKRAFYRRKILIIGILRAVGLIFSTSAKKKEQGSPRSKSALGAAERDAEAKI